MPKIGYKMSEETKKKISEHHKRTGVGKWMLGRKRPAGVTQKWLESRRGYRHSMETKEKIGLSNKGKERTTETRKKLSVAHLGYVMPEEQKRKISEHHKLNGVGKWMTGRKPSLASVKKGVEARRGYKHSEETKSKISKANKGMPQSPETIRKITLKVRRGKDNHLWRGGIFTPERVRFLQHQRRIRKMNAEGTHTMGEWELLKVQYGFICPSCGRSEPDVELTEDHIIPLSRGGSDYIENIQPLCRSCNSKKHTKTIKYTLIIKKEKK